VEITVENVTCSRGLGATPNPNYLLATYLVTGTSTLASRIKDTAFTIATKGILTEQFQIYYPDAFFAGKPLTVTIYFST
jgi:hypothetical protein